MPIGAVSSREGPNRLEEQILRCYPNVLLLKLPSTSSQMDSFSIASSISLIQLLS